MPRLSMKRNGIWMVKSTSDSERTPVSTLNHLHRLYKAIEDGYTYANRTLLQLLMNDQALIPRLRSLKRYFFLSQSSFLTHFMDLAASELRKPSKGISTVKLQSLLDLA